MMLLTLIPPIALLIFAFYKRIDKRPFWDLLLMSLPSAVLYTWFIGKITTLALHAYFYASIKFILFVLPGLVIMELHGYELGEFGLTRKRLILSLYLGLGVLLVTMFFYAFILPEVEYFAPVSFFTFSIPMFLDAFNEEFLFRSVYFLFVYKKSDNLWLAFAASSLVTILWHPFEPIRITTAFVQGALLCYVFYRSKNIVGPWVSHGLNRTFVQLLGRLL